MHPFGGSGTKLHIPHLNLGNSAWLRSVFKTKWKFRRTPIWDQNKNVLKAKLSLTSLLSHWPQPARVRHRPNPTQKPYRNISLHHRQTQPCPGPTQPAPKFLTHAHLWKLPWLIALIRAGDSALEQQVDSNPTHSRIQGHWVITEAFLCVSMSACPL